MKHLNKRGDNNALGIIGIITMILIIDGVMIYFASALGEDIRTKEYEMGSTDCDCGTITCSEYEAIYGSQKLIDLCNSQEKNGFKIDIVTGFRDAPIISYIIFLSNVILIIAGIIILRGGSG